MWINPCGWRYGPATSPCGHNNEPCLPYVAISLLPTNAIFTMSARTPLLEDEIAWPVINVRWNSTVCVSWQCPFDRICILCCNTNWIPVCVSSFSASRQQSISAYLMENMIVAGTYTLCGVQREVKFWKSGMLVWYIWFNCNYYLCHYRPAYTLIQCFPTVFFNWGNPKIILISRGTLACETVSRPGKVVRRERNAQLPLIRCQRNLCVKSLRCRKQWTYNVISWCIRVTIFALETQQYVPFLLFLTYT
jgi:hypothetical protein